MHCGKIVLWILAVLFFLLYWDEVWKVLWQPISLTFHSTGCTQLRLCFDLRLQFGDERP